MYKNMVGIIGKENLNILSEEQELSNENSHYKLIRKEDW
jgi:hypothetical protein